MARRDPGRPWGRSEPGDYAAIDLRARELLRDVPLHDVWRVDLPGGGAGRTLMDVRPLMDLGTLARSNGTVRELLRLRRLLGRVFGWDAAREALPGEPDPRSFLRRLTAEDHQRSLVPPGSPDGAFTVLYVREHEAVEEIRNATVHAFSVLALVPGAAGYRLLWAIHVAPVGRISAVYMALIDPFRRLLVYPALLRFVHRAWCARYPAATT